jgi:hypothetical protein
MKFPKRTSQHLSETDSFRILREGAPRHWLVRELSERDYGVDAHVELVTVKGEVTGDLCSIQLKNAQKIKWKTAGDHAKVSLTIRPETVNYWMGLPFPVFLVYTDSSAKKAYFCPVKRRVRSDYATFLAEKPMKFVFDKKHAFGADLGDVIFILEYAREKHFVEFAATVRELFIHFEQYLDFVQTHQGWDVHLGLELPDEITFLHLYKSCYFVSEFLGVDWKLPTIKELCGDRSPTLGVELDALLGPFADVGVCQREIEANLAIVDRAGLALDHPAESVELYALTVGDGDLAAGGERKGAAFVGDKARLPQDLEGSCLPAPEGVALEHPQVEPE